MPVRINDNDFYSLHGIWGADSCLALGRIGHGAGMVVGKRAAAQARVVRRGIARAPGAPFSYRSRPT